MTRLCDLEGCDRRHAARGFCLQHWERWRKNGDPGLPSIPPSRIEIARRRDELIAQSVASRSRAGCWTDWPGAHWAGYPAHRQGRVSHRVLELVGQPRPAPPNDFALHSCDNPACWNPDHLRWGSQVANMADARERGRLRHQTKVPG